MLNEELVDLVIESTLTSREAGYFPDTVTYVTPQGNITSPIEEVYEMAENTDLPLEVVTSSIRKRSNAIHVVTTLKIGTPGDYSNVLYYQSAIEDRLFLCYFGVDGMQALEIPANALYVPDMYGRKVLEN